MRVMKRTIRGQVGSLVLGSFKSLDMELDDSKGRADQEKTNNEYEDFLRDLEENPQFRLYHYTAVRITSP